MISISSSKLLNNPFKSERSISTFPFERVTFTISVKDGITFLYWIAQVRIKSGHVQIEAILKSTLKFPHGCRPSDKRALADVCTALMLKHRDCHTHQQPFPDRLIAMAFVDTLGYSGFPDDTMRSLQELFESDEYVEKINTNTMNMDDWDSMVRAMNDKSNSVGELWDITGRSAWLTKHRADQLAFARDVVGSDDKCFCGRKGHKPGDCYINPKGKKPDLKKILLALLKNSNVNLDHDIKIAFEDMTNERYSRSQRDTYLARQWGDNYTRPQYGAGPPGAAGGGGGGGGGGQKPRFVYQNNGCPSGKCDKPGDLRVVHPQSGGCVSVCANCYENADKPHENKVNAGRACDGSNAACKGKGCKFYLRGAVMRHKMGRLEYESIFRGDKYFQKPKWTSGPLKVADTVNVIGSGRESPAVPAGRDLIPSARGNTHHA